MYKKDISKLTDLYRVCRLALGFLIQLLQANLPSKSEVGKCFVWYLAIAVDISKNGVYTVKSQVVACLG